MSPSRQKFVNILSPDLPGAAANPTAASFASCVFHAKLHFFAGIEPAMIFLRSNHLARIVTIIISTAALVIFLVACGDPKYQPPAIAVTFFSVPPTSMDTDSTIGIAAVVANDTKNAGVTFSCAPSGECGLFNPAQIASNVPTCYQAPGQVPAGNTVAITATSVTDPTKFVTSLPIAVLAGAPVQACAP
jgi:hypothetical protein